jgi:hypothetical protein
MKKLLLISAILIFGCTFANAREVTLHCKFSMGPRYIENSHIYKIDFDNSIVTEVSGAQFSDRFRASITPEFIEWHNEGGTKYQINRITGNALWVNRSGDSWSGPCVEAGKRIGD